MCRGALPAGALPGDNDPAVDNSDLVLERLQARLQQQLNLGGGGAPLCGDHLAHAVSRGSGPRIFCGHVPPECTEELVKAHFSQWGHVMDVYFPKRKDTFRRRPFCFVTFVRLEDAQRALAESPMNICGIPIKQLNLVEDRSNYYAHRHQAAQSALVQALQTLALLGNEGQQAAPRAPQAPAPQVDLSSLAALLNYEATGAQLNAAAAAARPAPQPAPQAYPMHQACGLGNGYAGAGYGAAPRYAPAPQAMPTFAGLPGFSQASLGMPGAAPAFPPPQMQPSAFSPAALAAALAGPPAPGCPPAGYRAPGTVSPFSPLDGHQHPSAGSSPPRGELAVQLAAAGLMARAPPSGSGSSGSASPDLDAAAANRMAMWQLQSELLSDQGGLPAAWPPASLASLQAAQ